MGQQLIEDAGNTRGSLMEIIWDVYQSIGRHAHSSEAWDAVLRDPRIDGGILAGLARKSGIREVAECMKVKHPEYGVARAWKTPDGWQQLEMLTDREMEFDIRADARQVAHDLFQLRKKRDVMFAFHGWAPEIPEIVTK